MGKRHQPRRTWAVTSADRMRHVEREHALWNLSSVIEGVARSHGIAVSNGSNEFPVLYNELKEVARHMSL